MSIQDLQPLSINQYEAVKDQTAKIIKKRIGIKPERESFKREYGSLIDARTALVFVVFLSSLLVSSIHILDYVSTSVNMPVTPNTMNISLSTDYGFNISTDMKIKIQQIGFIVLSEFSMLLFMVFWQTERKTRQDTFNSTSKLQTVIRFLDNNKFLFLALLSMVYVIIANWNTVSNKLMAIMPPASTIGLGFFIESIISELLLRKREIDEKYTLALDNWYKTMDDITQHPDYSATLRMTLWSKLVSLKHNKQFVDAPTAFKVQAVYRELERDNWTTDNRVNTVLQQIDKTTEQRKPPIKHTKMQGASDIAREWWLSNPNSTKTYSEIQQEINVSRSTIGNVKNELIEEGLLNV